jgi:HEAT repeat protein
VRQATIDNLVAALAADDGVSRQRARELLVEIGKPSVAALVKTLEKPSARMRWEVAKALSEIKDPAAAPAMVQALEDKSFGVRWLAAEGLIALGHDGLIPLLEALVQHSNSAWLQEGAHHVLRTLAQKSLPVSVVPVLKALDDVEPAIEVIQPAKTALAGLRHTLEAQAGS